MYINNRVYVFLVLIENYHSSGRRNISTCIFNCGKKDKNLAKLQNFKSWKSLLYVALSKNYEPIISFIE